jgi:hypothetical protein
MSRSLKLTFEAPAIGLFEGRSCYRMRVVASEGDGVPDEIFLWTKAPANPIGGKVRNRFQTICGPFELGIGPGAPDEPLPIGAPDEAEFPPEFRSDVMDILLPSTESYAEVKRQVIALVRELLLALDRLDTLAVEDVVTVVS